MQPQSENTQYNVTSGSQHRIRPLGRGTLPDMSDVQNDPASEYLEPPAHYARPGWDGTTAGDPFYRSMNVLGGGDEGDDVDAEAEDDDEFGVEPESYEHGIGEEEDEVDSM
ncbi:uncharacterized protein DSM5745_01002 [Aspergillus mulundensis]|uniref:Uncharacterized protein n=1 Tax=Aspergillus mulundensis TaxID=1810919 RepID=A0A3D8T557_9EURO|nr:hypothetical protein DSM5745_01002 [Aspergillus mulundensis]RDW93680.1 hypothetical protein DSM5745_01002 [Aspergillus mulundensis]